MKPTDEYTRFDEAFDWYNERLFGGILPRPMFTLRAGRACYGYFLNAAFVGKEATESRAHEIALNPETSNRPDNEVLATLVHEMVHLYEQEYGKKPPTTCYHTKEWAAKMEEIGLLPYNIRDVDLPYDDRRKTGQYCSHLILLDGKFDQVTNALLETGWRLAWVEPAIPADLDRAARVAKRKAQQKKTKYECPGCQAKAWAKPNVNLICGDCEVPMEVV